VIVSVVDTPEAAIVTVAEHARDAIAVVANVAVPFAIFSGRFARSVTKLVVSASACVCDAAAFPAKSETRFVTSDSAWVCAKSVMLALTWVWPVADFPARSLTRLAHRPLRGCANCWPCLLDHWSGL
jgi:hypothetical protein